MELLYMGSEIDSKIKIGVDPDRKANAAFQMPYDEFFAQNKQSFDLIFINGLHDATQVEIAADPDRLLQVLTNLLSNAVKFSPPNSTSLSY